MTQPAKAQEPSMEEILASIRRIISDDEAKPAAAAAAPVPAAPAQPEPAPKPKAGALTPVKKPPAAPIPPVAAKAEPAPVPEPAPAKNSQDDIDAMLASFEAEPEPAPVAEADMDDDVFELTEQMAITPAPEAEDFRTVEPNDDLEFSEPAPVSVSRGVDEPAAAEAFLSGATAQAVGSAFNALATTVLSNNARTLEDLVKEMLRPMLKSWLDDNLPGMVERIVKAEIERVARGR